MGCYEWFNLLMCMYVLLYACMVCCIVVRGYAHVWPVIRGVSQSDYGLATGFGPFNLTTCGPLLKGRDHYHMESGKHIIL